MSDVTVTFGAKDDGLKAAIGGASKGVDTLIASFAGLGAALVSFGAVKTVFDSFKGLADYAGQVSDLSAQTGLTAEATMVWGQALKNAGMGADALQGIMNRLQKAMSGVNDDGEVTNKAFEKLGINVDTLRSLAPDKQLESVKSAISGIADPAERASVAIELFGKSGGKALSLFTDSSALDTARQQLGGLAENLGTSLAGLDKLSDALSAAGEIKTMQLLAGFAEAFSGNIESAADAINKMDLSVIGRDIGFIASGAKQVADELMRGGGAISWWADSMKYGGPLGKLFLKPAVDSAIGTLSDLGKSKYSANKISASVDAGLAEKQATQSNRPPLPVIGSGGRTMLPTDTSPVASTLSLTTDQIKLSGKDLDLRDESVSLMEKQVSLFGNVVGGAEKLTKQSDANLTSLGSALDQTKQMVDFTDSLREAKERIADADERSLKATLESNKATKTALEAQLQAVKEQLNTIANADPQGLEPTRVKARSVGVRGSRIRAAENAQKLEKEAADEEALMGKESARAKRLRGQAAKDRAKAFPSGKDDQGNLESNVKTISDTIKNIEKRLPVNALTT